MIHSKWYTGVLGSDEIREIYESMENHPLPLEYKPNAVISRIIFTSPVLSKDPDFAIFTPTLIVIAYSRNIPLSFELRTGYYATQVKVKGAGPN